MRGLLTCLLVSLMCHNLYGQAYKYTQILDKADSILSSKIGPGSFLYCTHDPERSYYSYAMKKKERFREMGNAHKTRKHFMSATIAYRFCLPYPKCPCMDTIAGNVTIELDTALNQVNDIDLNFIPDFVRNADSCRFISKEQAIDIALQQHLHLSVSSPYAYIRKAGSGEGYVWVVLRTIWNEKNVSGRSTAKDDMIVIDAVAGTVTEHKVVPYAPHGY